MSEKRKFRSYDLDFKKQVVSLVLDEGLSRSEVARRFDLAVSLVCQWVKNWKEKRR